MADVRISSVTKKFGEVYAVNKFYAVIRDGEFVSILGPSGCGKTTMLRMIAGFEKATGGEIAIGDQIVSKAGNGIFVPPEKRHIGMVFQSYAVWPHMNVFDNVAFGLRMKGRPAAEIATEVRDTLRLVQLEGFDSRTVGDLSGGQQQQLAIGRALACKPQLLILDEPTEGIQPSVIKEIGAVIRSLANRGDMAILLVEQFYDFAAELADQYLVMSRGTIIQRGRGEEMEAQGVRQLVAI